MLLFLCRNNLLIKKELTDWPADWLFFFADELFAEQPGIRQDENYFADLYILRKEDC